MKIILNVSLIIVIFSNVFLAQSYLAASSKVKNETTGKTNYFTYVPKNPGYYTANDWAAVIDSTWGPGLPTTTKLQLFDNAWNILNQDFAAFHGLEVDWDSVVNAYRDEISAGVSRGRFAAIMNHFSLAFHESHTLLIDLTVI
jgi:hypothetical protein